MSTSDWITLGAAILTGGGTLFLGIMAWRTIRQTRSIQKGEKRERLLSEIIEWAMDVAEGGSKEEIQTISEVSDQTLERIDIEHLIRRYKPARARMLYMCEIAVVLGEDLHSAVVKTAEELLKFSAITVKHLEGRTTQEQLSKQELQLFERAHEVMEKATEIKTRDIS